MNKAIDQLSSATPVAADSCSQAAGLTLLPGLALRYEPFPLTEVQRAYWLGRGDNFELGNVGCHVYFEFHVPDADRSQMEATWQRLIDRHDMLRAVIRADGTQQILPHTPHYEIKHLDLRGTDDGLAQSELQDIRRRMSHQVFSPERWPLFELRTTELRSHTLLHFSLDLLFVDLWSMQLLFDEWVQLLYSDPYLTPLEINFRDYVLAAASLRDAEKTVRAREYWLGRIESIPSSPKLPLVKPPSAVRQPRFVRRQGMLEHEVWRKLRDRGAKAGLSPSGILMAAFARVLATWSETPHFTLNVTLFERVPLHPQVSRLVGDFTSILLLEVCDEPADTFGAMAQRLAAQFRADLDHREYGGLRLLQEIAKRGDVNRPALMPVVFTSALAQNMPGWRSADHVGELIYGVTQTPQIYLDHQVYERGQNLHFTWDAVEELFPAGLLDEMFAAYAALLQRLATDENAWTETRPKPAAWAGLAGHAGQLRRSDGGSLAALDKAPWPPSPLISSHTRRNAGEVTPELAAFLREVDALEDQSTDAIIETLQSLGLFKTSGETWTVEEAVRHCRLLPHYSGLLSRWLGFLASDGLLISDAPRRYRCSEPLAPRPNAATPIACDPLDSPLAASFQEFRRNLVALLRGETGPLDLLFPGADWRVAEALYQHNPLARRINEQAAAILQELVGRTSGRIRVLELGGGIGSLTSSLLPVLPADRTAYLFTDITQFFHAEAKRRFARFPFVEYGIIDALSNPMLQGLLPCSFDLIVAASVLHNAEQPAETLAGLRPLLAPGGMILLIEATRNTRAHAVTIGFIEGLSSLSDEQERPFLPMSRWIEALEAAGFCDIETGSDPANQARDLELALILARVGTLSLVEQRQAIEELKSLPLVAAGALPPSARRKLKEHSVPAAVAPGGSPVQTWSAVETALAEIWSAALGRDMVGAEDNFLQLGGDSLIAVRIVAALRERFQLLVRAQMLFEAPTVRQMAIEIERLIREQDREAAANPPTLPRVIADPASRAEPFPLTEIQQAYWIGRSGSLELGNVGAHFYLETEGSPLEADRLERAWQQLIERHGMLRTVVLPQGQQKLLEPAPRYQIETQDLAGASPDERDRVLEQVRARMSHQLYAGERWPPFEVRLTRIAADRSRLHLSFDLLMIDLWSLRLLMHELLTLYQEPQTKLPALEIGFRDYALAVAALEQTETWKRSFAYWNNRLSELPPPPELPLSRDPATITRPRFTRRSESLAASEWQEFKEHARAQGLTASSALLAAFTQVLAAWSRQPKFTINLTLFQRLPVHPQVNQIVGDFTSTILLSVDCESAQVFAEHGRKVQAQLWRDLDHRHVSGVRVIRELARSRETGIGASMPVVFTSGLAQGVAELKRLEDLEGQGLGEVIYSLSQTPQVWLDHQVYEQGGRLFFNWDAVEELFPSGLLDDMFSAYCSHLRHLAQDQAAWSKTSRSFIPAAQLAARAAANDTAAPVPAGLLHGPFLKQARVRPRHSALVTMDRCLTYEDVYRQARILARRLCRIGVGRDRLVAVVMEKGWEQVVAVIAILEAGAAYLPLDPDLPQERLCLLLRRGEVEIALTQPRVAERLEWPAGVTAVPVDWHNWQDNDDDDGAALAPMQSETDLAYVIFTSGSTGEPKGVMVEHRSALSTVLDINERFGVGAADRILALSTLSFDLSVYDIFGALAAGATIVFPHATSYREPGDWACLIREEGITLWNSVPALLEMLVDHVEGQNELLGGSLRLALLSGDWIPVKLPDRARAVVPGLRVISLGGATEASIWSIFYPIAAVSEDWRSIPYGRPLRNQQIHVLSKVMQPCPTWVEGEIYISGTGLARGYWRDEARTEAQFVRHPQTAERLYRTGDLGRYLPGGDIEFLGREDEQVKIQGYRIELGEIETALLRHPQVKAAAVTAVGERSGSKHLAAYVASEGVAAADLSEYLRQKLPGYMVPNVWRALDRLPLTANGKVNRRALPDAVSPSQTHEIAAPRASDTLARVSALLCEELGRPSLEPKRNLLTLGATSIDLVRIIGRLEEEFDFRPSFQEFFRDPTAAALAGLIEGRHDSPESKASSSSPSLPRQPLSFDLILDPEAREAFRRENRGIRAVPTEWGILPLQRDGLAALQTRFCRRRTVRSFVPTPVPVAAIGAWLAELSRITLEGVAKHAYGSAGSCYPVQTYLHAKADGISGCPMGSFYYDPVGHRLLPLTLGADIDPAVHEAFTNRPIFEQARFSLFFVNQPAAIEPIYGELGLRFSLLEAGAMAQALEASAWRFGLGVCPIGWIDFPAIRALFHLEDGQELLHAHVGGVAEPDSSDRVEGVI